jgi:hypothetical protein
MLIEHPEQSALPTYTDANVLHPSCFKGMTLSRKTMPDMRSKRVSSKALMVPVTWIDVEGKPWVYCSFALAEAVGRLLKSSSTVGWESMCVAS